MKNKFQKWFPYLGAIVVFLIQLIRGFSVPQTEPGFLSSGAANAPLAVIFSAIIASVLSFILFEILFWIYSKIKR